MYKVAFKSILASLLLLVLSAVPALALKGTPDVTNTVHNLSASQTNFTLGSDEAEVCIFCHTPHGGSLTGPLWNRGDSTAGAYTHYTSSTLSSEVAGSRTPISGLGIYDESRLCLSCHDGSISMYQVMNVSNVTNLQPVPNWSFDGTMRSGDAVVQGPRIGQGRDASGTVTAVTNDLSDDHPISFSYDAVVASADYQSGGKVNQLHDTATAKASGVRFFGAENRVECSSCHDPHVEYTIATAYAPFLITPNAGSALCLACHNK